ncbi:MAG: VWA domain-containing protein [Pirellulales bacterium]|nr:VWA domain-containing protein [Pirellulales bacterium]
MTQPFWLAALLLALPPLVYFWRRSLVHFAPWQRNVSLAVRILVVALLVTAICGVQTATTSRRQCVVFVVDRSASISGDSRRAADAFMAESLRHAGDNRALVLPFATEPATVGDPGTNSRLSDTRGTDLASAIAAAGAAIAETYVPKIVLLSDGYQTTGDGVAAAERTTVPISVKPLPGQPDREILVPVLKPRVLLVEAEAALGGRLQKALESDLIDVDVRTPAAMPQSLAELQGYDLVMLCNVPAASLSGEMLASMQPYVHDLGGGLIVTGGKRSFTAGGYRATPMEEMLPVASSLSLAMVLVIDQSGSMEEEGRIDLAKLAGKQTVDMLGPRDLIGVLGFQDESRWICPLQLCPDEETKQRLHVQIDAITTAYARTNLYPAMQTAFEALQKTAADLRHMIVLTDGTDLTAGQHKAADFEELTRRIVQSGVTISTVAVGKGSDVKLLQDLAGIDARVHCYYRDEPTDVPAVFADDIRRRLAAGRLGLVEGSVDVKVVDASGVFEPLDLEGVPRLSGYIETLPKQSSRIVLATDLGQPLLAWWRFGRGLSVAYTSEVEGPWTERWQQWSGFDGFWAQLARYAMRKDESKRFRLHAGWRGGAARVVVDAFDSESEYLNGATGSLDITSSDSAAWKTPLVQFAPGRYGAAFPVSAPGECRVDVTLRLRDRLLHARSHGLLIRSPERLPPPAIDESLLRAIANSTGGRFDPQPAEVFSPPETAVRLTTSWWPYLLTAAALLFVLDVALKRIDLSRDIAEKRPKKKRPRNRNRFPV